MMNNTTKCRNKYVSRILFALFLGQVVSLALAILGFTSSLLANQGVHAPLTQSFFSYLTLALVYIPILLSRCRKLMVPWYWYALAGFVDSVGNYLITKAYQFSSITSVSLLACWTILWVIILTWIFIGTRYSVGQFVGSAVCIGGLALVFLSDSKESGSGGRNPILGDVLVLCGTIGFALSNVGEEFCVKKRDRVEYIAMLAVFGLIVTMSAISMFERENLQAIKWSPEIISIFAAHAFSSFMFYTILPFVLKIGGSTLFNLSALTTNMWAVVIRLFFYHNKVEWLYFLSFAVVTIGLIIYSVTDKDSGTATDTEVGESNIHYQVLAAENDEIMFASNDGRSEQRVCCAQRRKHKPIW